MAKLISLKGATIKFNEILSDLPPSIENSEIVLTVFSGICNINIVYDSNSYDVVCSRFQVGQSINSNFLGAFLRFNHIIPSINGFDMLAYSNYGYTQKWTIYVDGMGMDSVIKSPTITNFDFPDLNENAEFISWVSENATIEGGVWESEHKTIIKNPICLVGSKVKKVVVDNVNMTIDIYTKEVPE